MIRVVPFAEIKGEGHDQGCTFLEIIGESHNQGFTFY